MEQIKINKSRSKKDAAEYHLFSDNYYYYGNYKTPTTIKLTRYNATFMETTEIRETPASFRELIAEDCINWFHVTGFNDPEIVTRLLKDFQVIPVDIKAVFTPCHASKIDYFDKRLFIVLQSCFFDEANRLVSEHIAILAKENILFTFKETEYTTYENTLYSLSANTMNIRRQQTGTLIAFILNSIFSVAIGVAVKVENILEKMDDILLDSHHNRLDMGYHIQQCRHANLIIQKNCIPLKSEFSKLLHTPWIANDKNLLPIYNELYNQLDFIILTAQNSKELLSSMRDLYTSSNDLRTNTVMKRLTIVSTLFIPITFLAGLWGMNFRFMPELNWKYGYVIAWSIISGTAYLTWHYMKKNRWF